MADELDEYRLRQVEEISAHNAGEIAKLKEREAVSDVKMAALERSNNRVIGAFVAVVVSVVGAAALIIVLGGHP